MCPYHRAKEGQQAPARICLCWKVDLGQVMPSAFLALERESHLLLIQEALGPCSRLP